MATQYDTPYLFSANGATAEVGPQDLADANYVGIPADISGLDSPEHRESFDLAVEADGATHGNFYYGRRPFSFEVLIDPGVASVNAQIDKLNKATNAMRSDGTLTWTETGRVQTRLLYRRTGFRISDKRPKRVLVALVAANPRIEAATETDTTLNATIDNLGNTSYPPRFTFATPANPVITNTTTGEAFSLTITGGGTLTVDFANHTVTQGGVSRYSSVNFTTSTWWDLVPGSNAITVTGGGTTHMFWRSAWL